MNLIKKILIAIVVLLFTYIVWRLLTVRMELHKKLERESFTLFGTASTSEINNLKNTSSINIQNCTHTDLPLREYVIKAAYNSALTGNYVNIDMIKYVLSRGCRFLDLEIYYIGQTTYDKAGNATTKYTPQVAYSTDNTFTTIDSENSILLDDVLNVIVTNAFSTPCPNMKDPLFINMRIKSNNPNVYKSVASSIHNTIAPKLYVDTTSGKGTDTDPYPAKKVTNSTIFSDIAGKAIICMDKTIARNYEDYTSCKTNVNSEPCYDFKKCVNIETGSSDLNLLRYSDVMDQCIIPININDDDKTTTVQTTKYVIPNTKNDNSLNPVLSNFILKYSAQIPGFRFYCNDKQLKNYETFFNDNSSAFVPLAIAISYYQKQMN
jgi:uncharacterized protein YpmS